MIKNKKINNALIKLSFVVFMCIIAASLSAQSITVRGKVTDNSNKAMPSITVAVKGSTARVLSDANGEYSINVPDRNAVLVFSFADHETQEITVDGQTEINVSLRTRQRGRNVDYVIEGVIVDETGEPFEGVTLYLKDRITLGTTSSSDGRFSIKAARGNVIVFSFVGYEKVDYIVSEEKKDVEIQLIPEAEQMDEIVVVGLGSQRKISSLAAVTSVNTKDLQVPAPSITNMLGGRVAGIISMQYSGEPGENLAEFWVRGIGTFGANDKALVLIDGLEGDINSIDPADVESFSILKDASATAVYGVRGANGVVIITTKRGEEGKLNITGRANFSVSHLRNLPEYLRAYDYATLVNEAYELRGDKPLYDEIEMAVIRDHLDPDLYPDVSWQDEILNKLSFKQSYFASISGGGSIARYYTSIGMSDETGAYKAEKGNPYATNAGYSTYSFRMNLDINLSKSTTLYFGSDAFMSINNKPGQVNTQDRGNYIWEAQSRLTPLIFPVRYSNGQLPASTTELFSPYVMINQTGKHSDQNNRLLLTMAVSQDLSALIDGLKIRVQGAYNRDGSLTETRFRIPDLYFAERERDRTGQLVTRRVVYSQEVTYSHPVQAYRKYHFEGTLNYDQVFGKRHRVGGLIYYYMSDQQNTKDLTESSLSGIPIRYQGLSSRLTYGYKDTYMIDLNFGYTGSENFMPGRQFGFFPSIALGWSPSAYQWVKDNLKWINFLKIRGSYGTVGNDRLAGDTRFPYLSRISQGIASPWGMGAIVETVNIGFMGADNLRWEKAIKSNIGVDATFWDKKISLTVDFFNDQRDGIFQPRVQVPDYIGLVTNPYGNVGKMKSWGSDGNISFTQDINKDISFTLRGNYTFAQNLVENWEEVNQAYPYKEYSGKPHEFVAGYQCLGFFTSEEDIRYSPVQFGSNRNLRPGDLKYKDINGDGKIDEEDRVPLSLKSMYPTLMYGFGGEFRYKNISVGVLLRGTGKVDYFRNGWGYMPLEGGSTGNILVQFKDPATRWIPREYAIAHGIDPNLAENPNARIPRLQYGNNTNNSQLSDFWKGDARYLRLQEITVNYNFNNKFLKKLGISSIDLQFVGNNLYVWDKVKVFDPEQADKKGEVYPIPAVYSLQLYIRL
ncbi:MAG: SusC/RagA family TonB-linked outer membrane protein [Tannerella sp.]|jgi:TonB-linked SusC/RagA family outer membrane protein|nr:SusC/RagA family TonB-linked outer membrane protein [Tannerella sp.]